MSNFHQKTQFEMATELRAQIDALPVIAFADLQPGSVYHYKNGSSESVCTVTRMLPSRKMADVLFYRDTTPRRITPTRYYGKFRLLNDELREWLGVTHEAVIDKAIAEGLEIPARVRIHYPDKFIQLPERFTVKRLREVLAPQWGHAMTVEKVDAVIAEQHRQMRGLQESRAKAVMLNPDTDQDYDKYIQNCIDDIDFYRWLRPQVDVGGVFYLNGEKP